MEYFINLKSKRKITATIVLNEQLVIMIQIKLFMI